MTGRPFTLIGGPEADQVRVVDHDPEWPRRFEGERARLAAALGDRATRIDHVGSTAVPGLAAKPIVDISVSVADPDDEAPLTAALEPLGLVLRVSEAEHCMYRTPVRDLHVHFWPAGSDHERRHLLFRDWLRHDADDRALYQSTKRRLAQQRWTDMNDYAGAKSEVIAVITERAEAWASRTAWTVA